MLERSTIPLLGDELNGVGVCLEETCTMEVESVSVDRSLKVCATVCVGVALKL